METLERILSLPLNKPFRTRDIKHDREGIHRHLDRNGFVIFTPDDPEDPKNWSDSRRWQITVCAVLLIMNATFASSAPSGAFVSMAAYFDVSLIVVGLTITVFLLGYVAGPLMFAPLSEFYGRRYVFYITFTLYLVFTFLCAFPPNFAALLVGRFLTGTFVSAPLSNVPGVLADIWDPLERGNAMAGLAILVYVGPTLGPIVAGFIQLSLEWQWVFYVLLILGGVTAIIMLTIPETHAPTILTHKARRIRQAEIPGHETVRSAAEASTTSLAQAYKVALTRPWIILFDPISFLCAIYMAVVYTLLYMLFTIYPIVFQERRGWNSGVGALPLLGNIVGSFIGGSIVWFDTRRLKRKILRGEIRLEDMEPEDRLPMAIIGGIAFPISMFWFAWTAEYTSIHWIVPIIGAVFLAASLLLVFTAYQNYLVDTYRMYAASAVAANTIMRSACGAAAPLFTNQMFHTLGVGGGGSLVGGVATLLAIIPFLFYRYGKTIRMKSRFAPTPGPPREKDVETNAPAEPMQIDPEPSSSSSIAGSAATKAEEDGSEIPGEDGPAKNTS